MDQYIEAVRAAGSADKARRWAQPVKVFGHIVIGIAAATVVLAVASVILGLFTSQVPSGALAAFGVSSVIAVVLFLQGSAVLMVAYYIQMRAEEVSARVTKLLEDDGEDL